ncbi:uncharacterized protein LOC144124739 isoform X2 [Amblyomma americanum]
MFAVVRFVHDIDKKLHVIPAKDIANFNPGNNTDFNTRSVYTAFWRDPLDGQDSGHYSAQVLMLGESEKEIRERMAKKRLAMPKIPDYEESSSEEEEETAAQKKKKQKRLMLASKKAEYETILKKNMDNARTKTLAAQSRDTRQAAKKRARASSESASESEDSLCAKSELQEAINQKNFWKKRAKELDEERLFLREQVKSLQRCLESKIFQCMMPRFHFALAVYYFSALLVCICRNVQFILMQWTQNWLELNRQMARVQQNFLALPRCHLQSRPQLFVHSLQPPQVPLRNKRRLQTRHTQLKIQRWLIYQGRTSPIWTMDLHGQALGPTKGRGC